MGTRGQWLCLWCGPAFLLLFGIGFWGCAGFVPPIAPSLGAADVAAYYQSHTTGIRLGMAIAMGGAGLIAPWVALITVLMLRIRGNSPALAYTQLGAGCGGIVLLILPTLIWEITAFRPDRDPQLTLLLNDMGWIMIIVPFTLATVQCLALAAAILLDKAETPVFPRWSGYFNVWIALLFVPGAVAVFFKTGPFAWNGIFPWWIPFASFGTWFVVMFAVLHRILRRQSLAVPAVPA
ncbi:MAG: hypothetical protein JWQ90_805 [Hydrocarboniphaga sp.]|uniref:hypothetical protein n=1 Tax=Hydrocarboniphaga sp. TaxID=2033016 RepID=UPI002635D10D|nr:hypothetical protein [Hydrocarboniphaga sp.]MDB5968355.1 hypothetical protein [Hydrocarboniphaga sp.]